jgi:hypothetical protein
MVNQLGQVITQSINLAKLSLPEWISGIKLLPWFLRKKAKMLVEKTKGGNKWQVGL